MLGGNASKGFPYRRDKYKNNIQLIYRTQRTRAFLFVRLFLITGVETFYTFQYPVSQLGR